MGTAELVFFFADEFSDDDVDALRDVVDELRRTESWQHGPPTFIDQIEDAGSDDELRTVGGVLRLPSVGTTEIEALALRELLRLLHSLGEFSEARSVEFEVELDGTFVGAIENGEFSETLKAGLIEPWRARAAG